MGIILKFIYLRFTIYLFKLNIKGTTAADGNGQISNILKQVVIPILPSSSATYLYGTLPTSQIFAGVISTTNPGDSCQVITFLSKPFI